MDTQYGLAMNAQFGLTPRERTCLDLIQEYIDRHRCSPSYDDLMDALGITSKSSIHRLVLSLERRGHITRKLGCKRSIALLRAPAATLPGYTLPPKVDAALRAHCAEIGDNISDVVADAVSLFLDGSEVAR